MPSDLDFEQWVLHIFDHSVADPTWYLQFGQETWYGDPLTTVRYMTCLFESSERLLQDYSREQLEQGLWYLAAEGGPFIHDLLDKDVPWPVRERGLQSIRVFYEKFFAVACTDDLGHLCKTTLIPVNGACYMWWDIFPSYGHPEDPSRHDEDQTVLNVMRSILDLPSEACRESALHGLGHWQLNYPEVVRQIIDKFLETHPEISPPLRKYALAAQMGLML